MAKSQFYRSKKRESETKDQQSNREKSSPSPSPIEEIPLGSHSGRLFSQQPVSYPGGLVSSLNYSSILGHYDIDIPHELDLSRNFLANRSAQELSIPVNRRLELTRDIESAKTQLIKTQETISILEEKIANFGRINARVEDINQLQDAEKNEKRLKQIIDALTSERYLQNRYETELCAFAILREQLAIAKGDPFIPSADVLAIIDKFYPNIFNSDSILLGPDQLARMFENTTLIDRKIYDLIKVVAASPKARLLQERLMNLEAAKKKKQEKEEFSEDSSSLLTQIDIDLPRFSDEVISSFDIDLNEGWYLRISILRIPSDEVQISSDGIVLYESYPPDTMQMVRIAITYFAPWGLGQFNLSENPDLLRALLDLRNRLCDFCKIKPIKETSEYRFSPNCKPDPIVKTTNREK